MSFTRLGLQAELPAPRATSDTPAAVAPPHSLSTFRDLGLTPELLRSIAAQGYTEPTPVQAQSIPIVLAGRDLLASAQTGTGKTAAFVLPILQLLNATRPAPRPQTPGQSRLRGATGLPIRCLVLTPTRELALQIEESVRTYGAEKPVRSTTIYGGVGFQPQVMALRHGPEIVVATPGRLLDHAGQRTIDLSSVEILVLDEADRMLDMGFIHDIRRVMALLPARRQNLLFSATFSDEIRELAGGILDDAAEVQVARRNAPIELVRQVVLPVDRERKRELLSHLIRTGRIDRALVFTRTKHGANRLAEQLNQDGISASAIHGNKSQAQRVAALNDFKAGRVAILTATEIAARGLDIDGLPHVVNFEMPTVPEDYIHRIGRTGRAGLEGDAVSLVCIDETGLLDEVQRLLRQTIAREVIPGFEVDRSIRPEPIRGVGRSSRPSVGRRQSFARPSAPQRPADARRPAETRRPAVAPGARPAPSSRFEARPNGFNLSSPVEPRRAANGYRRPTAADFDPAGSSRPAAVPYRPAQQPVRPTDSRQTARPTDARQPARPAEFRRLDDRQPAGPARPRPAQARTWQAAPRPTSRPYADRQADRREESERRDRYVSLPGERIARRERTAQQRDWLPPKFR